MTFHGTLRYDHSRSMGEVQEDRLVPAGLHPLRGVSSDVRDCGRPFRTCAAYVAFAAGEGEGVREAVVSGGVVLLAGHAFVDARDNKERRAVAACDPWLGCAFRVLCRVFRALWMALGEILVVGEVMAAPFSRHSSCGASAVVRTGARAFEADGRLCMESPWRSSGECGVWRTRRAWRSVFAFRSSNSHQWHICRSRGADDRQHPRTATDDVRCICAFEVEKL